MEITRDSICAIIPAYGEANFIGNVIRQARLYLERVVVVDDGSRDGTADVAGKAGAEVFRHRSNLGKGAAIKTGLRHLLREPFNHFLLLDGDGQHDPQEIPLFLKKVEKSGAPLVIGNRLANSEGMPLIRRWTNRFMSWQIGRLCQVDLPDSQCGFRMASRALVPLLLEATSGFEFETEMIFIAARHGFRIDSVPIRTIYRNEQSKIRPVRDTLRYLKLIRKYRRQWAEAEARSAVVPDR
jgi:glycosyltransferase involved in cell wall biosynthesis